MTTRPFNQHFQRNFQLLVLHDSATNITNFCMGRESLFHFYSRYVRIIYVQCKTIHKQTPIASSKYELIYCDAKVLFLLFIGESNKFTSFICWPFYCRNVKLVIFWVHPKTNLFQGLQCFGFVRFRYPGSLRIRSFRKPGSLRILCMRNGLQELFLSYWPLSRTKCVSEK